MSKPLSILLGLLFIISGSSGCLESLDNSSNTEPESITSLEDVYSHVLQCENTIIENTLLITLNNPEKRNAVTLEFFINV